MKLYPTKQKAYNELPLAREVMQFDDRDIFTVKEVADNPYTGKQYAIAMHSGHNGEFMGYF